MAYAAVRRLAAVITQLQTRRPRRYFPWSSPQWCITCLFHSLNAWCTNGEGGGNGFMTPFRVHCVQFTDRDSSCETCLEESWFCYSLPANLERHRFELLALLKWVQPIFKPVVVPQDADQFGPRIKELLLSVRSRARVAQMMEVLVPSFDFLVRGYIETDAVASQIVEQDDMTSQAFFRRYRTRPYAIELSSDLSVRKLAVVADRRCGLGAEDREAMGWYNAVRNFRRFTEIILEQQNVPLWAYRWMTSISAS